jgi:methylglutaconyl-CoA hydratase
VTAVVEVQTDGGVARITLDSPRNRNALSAQLVDELAGALQAAAADRDVRAIVLSHTGPIFCSGADLRESAQGIKPRYTAGELIERIVTAPKLVISRLAGPARAGGLGLAAACDISIVVDTAEFAFTEVRIGVVPAIISLIAAPRLGLTRTSELFLTGATFSGRSAAEWGLFTKAVPATELDDEITRRLCDIGSAEPSALAATKQLVRGMWPSITRKNLAAMAELSATWFASEGAREGFASFAEKRAPAWKRALGSDSADNN